MQRKQYRAYEAAKKSYHYYLHIELILHKLVFMDISGSSIAPLCNLQWVALQLHIGMQLHVNAYNSNGTNHLHLVFRGNVEQTCSNQYSKQWDNFLSGDSFFKKDC